MRSLLWLNYFRLIRICLCKYSQIRNKITKQHLNVSSSSIEISQQKNNQFLVYCGNINKNTHCTCTKITIARSIYFLSFFSFTFSIHLFIYHFINIFCVRLFFYILFFIIHKTHICFFFIWVRSIFIYINFLTAQNKTKNKIY